MDYDMVEGRGTNSSHTTGPKTKATPREQLSQSLKLQVHAQASRSHPIYTGPFIPCRRPNLLYPLLFNFPVLALKGIHPHGLLAHKSLKHPISSPSTSLQLRLDPVPILNKEHRPAGNPHPSKREEERPALLHKKP